VKGQEETGIELFVRYYERPGISRSRLYLWKRLAQSDRVSAVASLELCVVRDAARRGPAAQKNGSIQGNHIGISALGHLTRRRISIHASGSGKSRELGV
jgi:hypothetical protein